MGGGGRCVDLVMGFHWFEAMEGGGRGSAKGIDDPNSRCRCLSIGSRREGGFMTGVHFLFIEYFSRFRQTLPTSQKKGNRLANPAAETDRQMLL